MGNVVFGWNKGRRQEINLGSKTNQTFVQIPTDRLKDRISQLCQLPGIRFIETEESYINSGCIGMIKLQSTLQNAESPEQRDEYRTMKRGFDIITNN